MDNLEKDSHFRKGTLTLCYLLSQADGEMTDDEVKTFELFKSHEGLSDSMYNSIINNLEARNYDEIYDIGISEIKHCDKLDQVKCLAWMNKVANADGFVDTDEWALIYKVYNKELGLNIGDILDFQLPKIENSLFSKRKLPE